MDKFVEAAVVYIDLKIKDKALSYSMPFCTSSAQQILEDRYGMTIRVH